jgi:hypothetical protein
VEKREVRGEIEISCSRYEVVRLGRHDQASRQNRSGRQKRKKISQISIRKIPTDSTNPGDGNAKQAEYLAAPGVDW